MVFSKFSPRRPKMRRVNTGRTLLGGDPSHKVRGGGYPSPPCIFTEPPPPEPLEPLQDSLSYLAPAHVRMTSSNSAKSAEGLTSSSSSAVMSSTLRSPSALEYVSSLALVFPMLVSLVDEEERSRVLSALAIVDTLAQVRTAFWFRFAVVLLSLLLSSWR